MSARAGQGKGGTIAAGERLLRVVKAAFGGLRDAVYPERVTCDICEAELVGDTRYALCAECTEGMPFVEGHICLGCGVPMSDEAEYCLRCQHRSGAVRQNRSPLVYKGLARQAVQMLKFGGRLYLAKTLGAMMCDAHLKSGEEAEILVPVPMTESEMKRRGFNQAELLAREVGRRLNIPVLPALVKTRETAPQKELTGKEREENLKGCFAVAYGKYIAGRKIMLIDDVYTTGATADECARTLLGAKARQVGVLTAAVTEYRLPTEPPTRTEGAEE